MTKKIYGWALVGIISLFVVCQANAMISFAGQSELARLKPTDEKVARMKVPRALPKEQGVIPGASNAARCKPDEFFIFPQGSDLGICVSPNVVDLSEMPKNMIADIVPEWQMLKGMPGELSAEHKIIPLERPFDILQNVSDKQRKGASQADINADRKNNKELHC